MLTLRITAHVRLTEAHMSSEHVFVTAQRSAVTRYRRALERRHIFKAEIAAKETIAAAASDADAHSDAPTSTPEASRVAA
jgi:hypothetical protein